MGKQPEGIATVIPDLRPCLVRIHLKFVQNYGFEPHCEHDKPARHRKAYRFQKTQIKTKSEQHD